MKRRMYVAVFAFMLCAHWATGQCNATVSGMVINESGDSVPGAMIRVVDEIGAKGLRTTFPWHQADHSGAFSFAIKLSAPGKVWLFADKKADGYPDAMNAFYAERDADTLTLDCGGIQSGIIIKIGPKAGFIGKIIVTDANTGDPISTASIKLRRVVPKIARLAQYDIFYGVHTSVTNIAIPSSVDISYEISAPGYVTSSRKTVNVRPLEEINISEQLYPSPPASGQPK